MSDYYVLNDAGRKQMFTMMDMLKNTYTDSERKKAPEENLESLDFTVL